MKKITSIILLVILSIKVFFMAYQIKGIMEKVDKCINLIDEQKIIIQEQQIEINNINQKLDLIKKELEKWEIITLEVTAYAPFDNRSGICADSNPNVTATGTRPSRGTVAVNPEIIPYGTRMFIPGYGWGIAEDTGSAIRNRDDLIDVFMDKHYQAIKWGKQELNILIKRRD